MQQAQSCTMMLHPDRQNILIVEDDVGVGNFLVEATSRKLPSCVPGNGWAFKRFGALHTLE